VKTAFRSLFYRLMFFVLLVSSQFCVADSKVFEGDGLPEPIDIELDFDGADYALVTASQRSADYVLSLKDGQSDETLKAVNIAALKFMDEVLFLDADSCVKCVIRLEGKARVDTASPYRAVIRYFTESEFTDIENKQLKELLEAISDAGTSIARTRNSNFEQSEEYRLQALKVLEKVTIEPVAARNLQWGIHAKSLRLQILEDLARRKEEKNLASHIISTADSNIKYLVMATYDLAHLSSDLLEKDMLYRRGMAQAKQIDDLVLYARGANRLAVSLVDQGQFDEALPLLEEARKIYASIRNFRALQDPLYNLSWANLRAGDLPKAKAYATEQIIFSERYDIEQEVIWAMYNMALAYGEGGEQYQAANFLDKALVAYDKLSDELKFDSQYLYGIVLQEFAESLVRLGDYDAALDYVLKMKAHFVSIGEDQKLARAKFVEGEIAFAQGQPKRARELIIESIKFEEKNNGFRNAGLRYLRLTELEMTESNFIQAASHQVAATTFLIRTEDHLNLAIAFSQAAELLTLMGSVEKAKEIATRAAGYIRQYGREQDHAKFAYRVALIESELGNFDSALNHLGEARRIIDETLPKVRQRDLRRHYFALQKSVFELNIKALLKTNQPKEALRVVESYKARTLREVIEQVGDGGDLSQELNEARNELHQKILSNAQSLYKGSKIDDFDVVARTRLLSTKLEKIEAELEISKRNGDYDASRSVELPGLSAAGELVAYYFIGAVDSWLWIISANGYEVFRLPPESELVDLIARVKKQISTHPGSRDQVSAWEQKKQLRRLSKILLAPMAAHLLSGDLINLTIISDGPLNGLPFSPLLLDGIDGPLIKQVAISHIPSNESRKALDIRAKSREAHDQVGVLVVADPVSRLSDTDNIVRLPYSANEAKLIESKLVDRAKLMLADAASKENVIPLLSQGYSILHFATHGLLNNSEPSLSGLMFSKLSEKPNFWLAPEISRANLDANLVVLSACESSIGKGILGEGMFSLSRAFIEGGASHVIGSLWKVEDASTADLMSHFYSSLLDDSLVVSVALQRAQIATYSNKNNDWRDPYYWAGFQLQGGWNTLSYGRKQGT